MQIYWPGQRWLSEAEPELGLGLVIDVSDSRVKLLFPASDEQRLYASQHAPLSRVIYSVGEKIRDTDGKHIAVEQVTTEENLVIYSGKCCDTQTKKILIETRLCHRLQLDQPYDRLLSHQTDSHNAFELRYATLRKQAELEQSSVYGLSGARVAIIPHQFYIAYEVAKRYAPRVLLADEVGLGKTIEACLILHYQLLTERAQRALVIVPPALISQWVLELMRRFNLSAAIFDESRCQQYDSDNSGEDSTATNPFLSEQLVICSLDFLLEHPHRAQQAIEAAWDLVIVDEAHHLDWNAGRPSKAYQAVAEISARTMGLLLLTATPEQLGPSGHFARLRLLDPARFSRLDEFIEEETQYLQAADAIEKLLSQHSLGREEYQSIAQWYPALPPLQSLQSASDRQRLVDELIDRHGTGRVLFRNRRAAIKGFPKRELHVYPTEDENTQTQWLIHWLKQHREKVLVICAQRARTLKLEQALHLNAGIRCAAFHDGQGLLARDRAAAWFAEAEGAQALICSEIGSEGRNFQFAHHLVLLDLPDNPDLLEQRIGRLDRIGQKQSIHIHVPYLRNTQQEVLFRWYNEGLQAFTQTCVAGSVLRQILSKELQPLLSSSESTPSSRALDALIANTQKQRQQIELKLERGRDKLLELSSFRPELAHTFCQQLTSESDVSALVSYLETACEQFGIDQDYHAEHCFLLRPNERYCGGFNAIADEGTVITMDRDTALKKEDVQFLTWEHPLIREMKDRVLSTHLGNAAIGCIENTEFPEGTLILECLFSVHSMAPKALQLGRYLPPTLFRIVVDKELRFISQALPFTVTQNKTKAIARSVRQKIIESQKNDLEKMLNRARAIAINAQSDVIEDAKNRLSQKLKPEIERLRYLQGINPSVRSQEIESLEKQYADIEKAITQTQMKLNAIRVLIVVASSSDVSG